MRNTIMIKIVLLIAVLVIFLQCIYVLGANRHEAIVTEKIYRIPEPPLPAL